MDYKKFEELRKRIKDIEERDACIEGTGSMQDSSTVGLKEQLGYYRTLKENAQPEFIFLESRGKSVTSNVAVYKTETDFGTSFFKQKLYLDRIGRIDITGIPAFINDFNDSLGLECNAKVSLSESLFLDIETTSLESGCGNCAYIIGIGFFEGGCFTVHQYFLRDFDEEHSLLSAVNEGIKRFKTVFTYNGKRFDLNILQSRYALNRIPFEFESKYHIDMLGIYRKIFGHRKKKLKLTELEKELLGIERIDDIPSQLIPEIYYQYLRTGYSELLEHVFEHNAQDIASLAGVAVYLNNALLEPERHEEICSSLYYAMGKKASKRKELSQAQHYFELVCKSDIEPATYAKICYELSRVYVNNGAYDKATELWNNLFSFYPEMIGSAELKRMAIHFERYDKDLAKAFYFAIKASEAKVNREEYSRRAARIFKKLLKNIRK